MYQTLAGHGATILMLACWCWITTGAGRLCLGAVDIRLSSRSETLFLSSGIGLALAGYAVFLLGITDSLNPFSILSTVIALATLGLAGWLRNLPIAPSPPAARSSWDRPAAVLLGALLVLGFLLVLTPETGKDALIYHLAVPKLYLKAGGFHFIPGNIFAGYPLLGDMHYIIALFFQNDILAKAMHFTVLCWILLGIGLFARRLMKGNRFPALAMLIFASIPSVFSVSHMAYNDLFLAFFTLAAIYAFLRWSEQGTAGWLVLCSLFCGSAAACKYTALLLLPLGFLGILWSSREKAFDTRRALSAISLFAVIFFAAGSPFYLKNWIQLGNPFYPFFYGIFGSRGWDSDQARLYDLLLRDLGMGREFLDYLLLPWNLSLRAKMDSPQFDGILGPVFLVTLPFLAGIRHWEIQVRIILFYFAATFLFWIFSAQQIRYLIPLFPLLAVTVGAILTRYRKRRRIFPLLLLLIAGSLIFNGWHIVREFSRTAPIRVAIGLESREDFLARRIPVYPFYRFANRELPPESRVFLIYMKNYTYLCDRICYSDAMFEAHTLQKILRDSRSPQEVRDRLRSEGFSHLLYDDYYLLGDPSPLSPMEKTLFLAFRENHLVPVAHRGSGRLDRLK